jgi:hypothetical protein
VGAVVYALPLVVLVALAAWLVPVFSTGPDLLAAKGVGFVMIFFFCILPLWNAALDTASLAATRHFLRQYLCSGTGWVYMTVLDLVLALLLTLLLVLGVVGLLHLLEALHWGVNAKDVLARAFINPTGSDANWMLSMALTNILPTLLHLGLACRGLWSGVLRRDAAFISGLQVAPSTGGPLAANASPLPGLGVGVQGLPLVQPLTTPQAQKLVNWVHWDAFLAASLPWLVALALWPLWGWLVQQALRLFL